MGYFGACCGIAAVVFLIVFLYSLGSKKGDPRIAFATGASFLLTMCLTADVGVWYNKINTAGVSESTVDLVVEHTSVSKKEAGLIMSKCAEAEMDLYDTLYIIDPTLTDEERMSIVVLNERILEKEVE